jgi:exoribonuclease R
MPETSDNKGKRRNQKSNRSLHGNADAVAEKGKDTTVKKQSRRNKSISSKKNPWGGRKGNKNENIVYPEYWSLSDCLTRYNAKDPGVIRGKVRVLPMKDAMGFCTCDRGSQASDVLLEGPLERNRALDGDTVYIELLSIENEDTETQSQKEENLVEKPNSIETPNEKEKEKCWWQDDPMQMDLWAPVVPIQRTRGIPKKSKGENDCDGNDDGQRWGRVVHVVPPKAFGSEINPIQETTASHRKVVGTLKRLESGTALLTCSSKALPQFRLSNRDADKFKNTPDDAIFQAKYAYGSWEENCKWPPCTDVVQFGLACNIEDETTTLLIDNQVDHGEFPQMVLEECQNVVASGEYSNGTESGWKPIPEMYEGRRDYRTHRIFTIDPTTAKDLDDALHVEDLGNGQVEIGVHIADVSHFVQQDSLLDIEGRRRCTTVYLVDRTIPMLPRPLCEIACSLNENVERLAISCVWRMNRDGSLVKGQDVWYGRTVIKVRISVQALGK